MTAEVSNIDLATCGVCDGHVSVDAEACPHCGCEFEAEEHAEASGKPHESGFAATVKGGLRHLFSLEGRVNRRQFAVATLILGAINLTGLFIETGPWWLGALQWIAPVSLVTFLVRRAHDIGKSGWLILGVAIPLFGALLVIYLWFSAGDADANRFGEPPLRAT